MKNGCKRVAQPCHSLWPLVGRVFENIVVFEFTDLWGEIDHPLGVRF